MFARTFSAILLCLTCAVAQAPKQFEVASVKPQAPGDTRVSIQPAPGGFAANGVPLKLLIQVAYGLKDFQVSGGPDWINTERYDILAKAGAGVNPTQEQLIPMLQALLADRFGLKVHLKMKDLPAFALVAGKGGSKLKPHAGDAGPTISVGRGVLTCQRIDMAGLADALGMQSDRTVMDETGISGEFDFTLKWSPEADQDTSGSSLVTAIQEQLGLKLESTKSPVEVLVIDSAQKASAN
jgi:uncharacterized protein (TIGR03435 family)